MQQSMHIYGATPKKYVYRIQDKTLDQYAKQKKSSSTDLEYSSIMNRKLIASY